VLYDAVLAVRRERPQIIVSTFVGGVTDGHGHHQVSGEIAQEALRAAADPKVFPEQLRDGIQPWQPLAVYSMVPFAPVTEKGMFDYATGKWAPARFRNYVTGTWIEGVPHTDVSLPVGNLDPALGRSYMQIAREGWGQQRSQNGGANPTLSGAASTNYHLWAVVPAARSAELTKNAAIDLEADSDLFHNRKVNIDTSFQGLSHLAGANPPAWLQADINKIDAALSKVQSGCHGEDGVAVAHRLAPIYRQTRDLYMKVALSPLDPEPKTSLLFELETKIDEFQAALKELLGLDLIAFTTEADKVEGGGLRGASADEAPRSVTPGGEFRVRVHTAWATPEAHLSSVEVRTRNGKGGEFALLSNSNEAGPLTRDKIWSVHVAENAEPTQPYFTRPDTEQAYYDLTKPEYRLHSFAPYPLEAWAEFTFDGVPIRLGQVVQTMERVSGVGGVYEPLVVTPAIGIRMEPEARILPLNGSALPVKVTVHAQAAAEGTVSLDLPRGWVAKPAEAKFHLDSAGDTEPLLFSVTPDRSASGYYGLQAVARSGNKVYRTGWQSVGYTGLRPYNLYRMAQFKTRKVDVTLTPGLRIGYVMGTGDRVPEAIEALGAMPHLLTAAELTSGDLAQWNVIVVGIRAYSARPELTTAQPRLDEVEL
jgi:hypothetical protein